MYYQKRDDKEVKAAVIVPKKKAFKATERSKIKRRMRSALVAHLANLEGINLVLYLKSKLNETSLDKFSSEIDFLIKKIN